MLPTEKRITNTFLRLKHKAHNMYIYIIYLERERERGSLGRCFLGSWNMAGQGCVYRFQKFYRIYLYVDYCLTRESRGFCQDDKMRDL